MLYVTPKPPLRATDSQRVERRQATRRIPCARIPVLFAHASAKNPTAGLIEDISATGVRIVAAPTARPMLHWGDSFRLQVDHSQATREAGIEGLELRAHVVRIATDRQGFVLHAELTQDNTTANWARLRQWLASMTNDGSAR